MTYEQYQEYITALRKTEEKLKEIVPKCEQRNILAKGINHKAQNRENE